MSFLLQTHESVLVRRRLLPQRGQFSAAGTEWSILVPYKSDPSGGALGKCHTIADGRSSMICFQRGITENRICLEVCRVGSSFAFAVTSAEQVKRSRRLRAVNHRATWQTRFSSRHTLDHEG